MLNDIYQPLQQVGKDAQKQTSGFFFSFLTFLRKFLRKSLCEGLHTQHRIMLSETKGHIKIGIAFFKVIVSDKTWRL